MLIEIGCVVVKLYICEDVKNAGWRRHIKNPAGKPDKSGKIYHRKDPKISKLFIKKCICDFIGEKENNIDIVFAQNDYGKPYINEIYKLKCGMRVKIDISLFFSLSHSDNMMVCAVACFNVGADCQVKNPKDAEQCRKIAKRFYSEAENKFLDSLDINIPDIYINNFFKIWTKKEAYIKYTGKGLSEGLNTFAVTSETRQKNYLGGVYFKRILPKKLRKLKRKDFCIYLCYNKANKNILEIKYLV